VAVVRTVVVAHSSRGDRGRDLARLVDAESYHLNDGDGTPDALWGAHKDAIEYALLSEDWTHLCILQDDALPIEDFQTHLQRAVEESPNVVISLYLGKGAPRGPLQEKFESAVRAAKRDDLSWAMSPNFHCYHGVGLVLPRRVAEVAVTRRRPGLAAYDQWIGMVCSGLKVPVLYTLPSLVDHDDSATPVRGFGTEGRVAHWVGVPTFTSRRVLTI